LAEHNANAFRAKNRPPASLPKMSSAEEHTVTENSYDSEEESEENLEKVY